MTENYKILGVSQSATDEQIKIAYRELAKKYHPDNYEGTPLAVVATEKMTEVNGAFDQIMNERRSRIKSNPIQDEPNGDTRQSNPSEFADIRALLQQNRVSDAEEILNGISVSGRTAEWYYLKGTIFLSRGWLEEATSHFHTATEMDPNNMEYREAANRMNSQRKGTINNNPYNRYNQNPTSNGSCMTPCGSCGACEMCQGLICADCCCECLGGDCISCC